MIKFLLQHPQFRGPKLIINLLGVWLILTVAIWIDLTNYQSEFNQWTVTEIEASLIMFWGFPLWAMVHYNLFSRMSNRRLAWSVSMFAFIPTAMTTLVCFFWLGATLRNAPFGLFDLVLCAFGLLAVAVWIGNKGRGLSV